MKKSLFVALSLTTLLASLITPVASAHTLVTDGSMGMLIHITPDDDPVAGEPSTINMEFKDTTNRFSLEKCDCVLEIFRGDTWLQRRVMDDQSGMSYQAKYTFPSRDIYQVRVTGTSRTDSAFDNFTLTFDQRIARGAAKTSTQKTPAKSKTAPFFWLAWTALIVVAGWKLMQVRGKRGMTQSKKSK